MFTMFTTFTVRLIGAKVFLVRVFEPGGLVGEAVLFFCAGFAVLDRVCGDAVRLVDDSLLEGKFVASRAEEG